MKTGSSDMKFERKQIITYRLSWFSWQGIYISTEDIFMFGRMGMGETRTYPRKVFVESLIEC